MVASAGNTKYPKGTIHLQCKECMGKSGGVKQLIDRLEARLQRRIENSRKQPFLPGSVT